MSKNIAEESGVLFVMVFGEIRSEARCSPFLSHWRAVAKFFVDKYLIDDCCGCNILQWTSYTKLLQHTKLECWGLWSRYVRPPILMNKVIHRHEFFSSRIALAVYCVVEFAIFWKIAKILVQFPRRSRHLPPPCVSWFGYGYCLFGRVSCTHLLGANESIQYSRG